MNRKKIFNPFILCLLIIALAVTTVPVAEWHIDESSIAYAAKADQENKNAQMGNSIRKLKGGKGTITDSGKKVKIQTNTKGSLDGIDISYWQGNIADSDWKKIQKSVDFVIIRCGYGVNSKEKDDSMFRRNVRACMKYNIPYGVYIYSYATNENEAVSEANHALRMVKGCTPDYPIYYDLEDELVATVDNGTLCKIAETFCQRITEEGYRAGVYANLDWWTSRLGSSVDDYSKWVAQWAGKCTYTGSYDIWQYSSNGYINGISQNFDVNKLVVPASEMNKFMEGAYDVFTGRAKKVEPYRAAVKDGGAVLRTGPGSIYKKKEKLAAGTEVNVVEVYRGYAHVVSKDAAGLQKLSGGSDVIKNDKNGKKAENNDRWILLSRIQKVK